MRQPAAEAGCISRRKRYTAEPDPENGWDKGAESRRRALAAVAALVLPLAVAGPLVAATLLNRLSQPAFPGAVSEPPFSARAPGGEKTPSAADANPTCESIAEGRPFTLLVPRIRLDTTVGFSRLVGNRLDPSAMKGRPALIDSRAREMLSPIGLPGVSLILGHRQWADKPLVFARLNELGRGDRIIIHGSQLTLSYVVNRCEEVLPERVWDCIDRVGAEARRRSESMLVLVTCAPYGFNWRRLLVYAKRADPLPLRGDPRIPTGRAYGVTCQ